MLLFPCAFSYFNYLPQLTSPFIVTTPFFNTIIISTSIYVLNLLSKIPSIKYFNPLLDCILFLNVYASKYSKKFSLYLFCEEVHQHPFCGTMFNTYLIYVDYVLNEEISNVNVTIIPSSWVSSTLLHTHGALVTLIYNNVLNILSLCFQKHHWPYMQLVLNFRSEVQD